MLANPRAGAWLLAGALLLPAMACSDGPGGDDLTVFAASSLTDVLPELVEAYEAAAGTGVSLVFGGSNHLAAQLRDGAPADAFLTADARLVSTSVGAVRFGTNRVVLAVPAGNPARISSTASLADERLRVAVCAIDVPCGAATHALGLPVAADTEEPSVRAVASRLSLGEADVGVVYETDIRAVDGIDGVPGVDLPPSVVEYWAESLTADGDRFVSYLHSDAAIKILHDHGFDA
jgi:molybdate transport system substrate-binding protein